jgi:polyphosphate kinase
MSDVQNLASQLERIGDPAKRAASDAGDAAQEAAERLSAEDRSQIARIIVLLYAAVIGVSIIYLVVRGWCGKEDAFDDISELVKIAVIPIVTLIIGYYFSKSK